MINDVFQNDLQIFRGDVALEIVAITSIVFLEQTFMNASSKTFKCSILDIRIEVFRQFHPKKYTSDWQ